MFKPIRNGILIPLLILSAGVAGGCMTGQADRPEHTSPPNIIVMYSDDHTAQAIGAYQGALKYGIELDRSPTPHIDRLAEGGMRFDNAFVSNSICKPSRAVFLSGMHSHRNGVLTNRDSIATDLETFPTMLQNHGYQTAMIGKWHLVTEPQGFNYYEVLHGQGPYYNPTMRTPEGDIEREGHTSRVITDSALDWLETRRDRDQPFMMIYNHKAPHRNWLPGPDHLDDYRDGDLPEPSTLFFDYSRLTTAAQEQEMEIANHLNWGWDLKLQTHPETGDSLGGWESIVNRNRLTDKQRERIEQAYATENHALLEQYGEMSDEEIVRWRYQRYVKDYLRVIRGLDDGVGRVTGWLEQEGLLDNTIVIYAGDQGFFLGEKGWFDKRWIYEESMRMPLIVHWPEGIAPGSVNRNLVQNLDLAPTLLDLAGVEIPEYMQGETLIPLFEGEEPEEWREGLYYHYYEGPPRVHHVARHYGVRSDRYTLVHFYDHGEWELFDLQEDPGQLTNVYDDPDYADVRNRLKQTIRNLEEKYEVPDTQGK